MHYLMNVDRFINLRSLLIFIVCELNKLSYQLFLDLIQKILSMVKLCNGNRLKKSKHCILNLKRC